MTRKQHGGREGWGRNVEGDGHRINASDAESEACRVWVGGCPKDITETEIEREFSKHGPVQRCTIKHSARDTFVFVQYVKESHARDAIQALNQAKLFGGCIVKVASANRKVINGNKDCDREHAHDDSPPFPSRRSGSPHGRKRSASPPVRKTGDRFAHKRSRSPPAKTMGDSFRPQRSSPPAKRLRRCVRVNVENLPRDMQEDELLEIASGFGYVTSYDLRTAGRSKTAVLDFRSTDEALKAVEELDDREIEGWEMKVKAFSAASD